MTLVLRYEDSFVKDATFKLPTIFLQMLRLSYVNVGKAINIFKINVVIFLCFVVVKIVFLEKNTI